MIRAKKDYETGLYAWFNLKQKYNLNIKQVFDIIFEVRKEREQKQ